MKDTLAHLLFWPIIVLLIFCFWLYTRTNIGATTKILKENGFTNIQLKDYKWFACAKDDWSHTGFTATNQAGNKIKGVICCGLIFKNCTIRYS